MAANTKIFCVRKFQCLQLKVIYSTGKQLSNQQILYGKVYSHNLSYDCRSILMHYDKQGANTFEILLEILKSYLKSWNQKSHCSMKMQQIDVYFLFMVKPSKYNLNNLHRIAYWDSSHVGIIIQLVDAAGILLWFVWLWTHSLININHIVQSRVHYYGLLVLCYHYWYSPSPPAKYPFQFFG